MPGKANLNGRHTDRESWQPTQMLAAEPGWRAAFEAGDGSVRFVTVVAWVFGCGVILFAPVGAVTLVREAPMWTSGAAGMVAFIVLVPTALAYSVNAWALRRGLRPGALMMGVA